MTKNQTSSISNITGWSVSLTIGPVDKSASERNQEYAASDSFTADNCEIDESVGDTPWTKARDYAVDECLDGALDFQNELNSRDLIYDHNDYRDLILRLQTVLCDANPDEPILVTIGTFSLEIRPMTTAEMKSEAEPQARYQIMEADMMTVIIMDTQNDLEFARTDVYDMCDRNEEMSGLLSMDDARKRAQVICDALNAASYDWQPDCEIG